MAMVYTKLERSFDAKELRSLLSSRLSQHGRSGNSGNQFLKKIERPPLPPASNVFEQAKGELEIERQTKMNGTCTLPPSDMDMASVCLLTVPGAGGSTRRPRSGNRSGQLSPRPLSPRPLVSADMRCTSSAKRSHSKASNSSITRDSPARTLSRSPSPCPQRK